MVRQSLRCFDETEHLDLHVSSILRMVMKMRTTHRWDQVGLLSGVCLSASAYCHTRYLVHMSVLKRSFCAISFSSFFIFVHMPNIAR
uniref:Uncharacterized protein n=1 Tax=Rhipicephalus zambeziensis TaxID=60191 RepID=A0A224YG12_9ACAR